MSRPALPRPSRSPRPAGRLRKLVLAGTAFVALVTGGSYWALTGSAPGPDGGAPADPFDDVKNRPGAGPGLNLLLVGIDRRRGLSEEEKRRLHVGGKECDCTDVMMLAHISRDRRRVSVVSIPRDSYVRFAPHTERDGGAERTAHSGKINGAFAHGGPDLTVATVERATGLRIDHYLETDFSGFADSVDRIGGGQVCSDKPLKDVNSGLDLPAGVHETDGRGALRYVRARHVPPPGDLGRVRRQQRFVATTLERLSAGRVLGDPVASARTVRALLTSVRTDKGLTAARLVALARSLRGLTADRTEFATVPIAAFDHRVPEWGSTLLWDKPRARELFGKLRRDEPITPDERTRPGRPKPVATEPAEIRVRVLDGHGAPDSAARTAHDLRATGFTVVTDDPGRALTPPDGTARAEIVYDPRWERYASTLATALPDARLRPVRGHGPVFEVTPGSGPLRVTEVTEDRSSVEGAAVTGDELDCR